MKKTCTILILSVLVLSACGVPTYETIEDANGKTIPAAQELILDLPPEAAQATMENGNGELLYQCDGYELEVRCVYADTPKQVMAVLSGQNPEKMTIMGTRAGDIMRYDCAWCTTGENGTLACRTVILDDGTYCYCATVSAPEESAGELRHTWQPLLDSAQLR